MFGAVAGGAGKYYSDARPGIGTFHDLDAEEPIFAGLLGSFGGKLETTAEVTALLRRNAVQRAAGDSSVKRNGHRLTLPQRIAGALSWRLMGAAMRLRRISEKTP